MSAFRKISVSATIMAVCIVLAVVIGIARKPFYQNLSYDNTGAEQTISQDLNGMTTYGKIGQAVYDVIHSGDVEQTEEGKAGFGIVGIIVIVAILVFVLKILGGSNRR